MRMAAAIEIPCRCARVDHEPWCLFGWVIEERGRLYDGLYDGRAGRRPAPLERVKLLNPLYSGDDPAARRFALIEIE